MNKQVILPSGTTAFSVAEIESVMADYAKTKLGKNFKADYTAFADSNRMAFTIMLNTWYYLIVDTVGDTSARHWKVALRTMGLSKVISEGDEAADAVLHGKTPDSNLWYALYQAVMLRTRRPRVWDSYGEWTIEPQDIGMFLQIARYAKRFTPNVRTPDFNSLNTFLGYQSELREQSTSHGGLSAFEWVTSQMSFIMNDLLDWDKLCDELEACWDDPLDVEFTPKGTADVSITKSELTKGISSISLYAKANTVYRLVDIGGHKQVYLQSRYLTRTLLDKGKYTPEYSYRIKTAMEAGAMCKLQLVPKNYKSFRTIAPEPTFWAAKALRCFRIMEKYLPTNIHLHDQRYNRALLERASCGYPIMTVDNSMASDGITWEFFAKVYPPRFVAIVNKMLTRMVDMSKFGRPPFKLVSLATMGHPMTFILESTSFCVADMYANQLLGLPMTTDVWDEKANEFISVPQVYGDDQITWSEALPVLQDICQVLGWKLNLSKTYADGPYREACGLEVYSGRDVTPVYWPRRPFGEAAYSTYKEEWETDMGALVTLQKELFYVSPGASNLLSSVILTLKPDMTSSVPGTDCSDIWAVVPRCKKHMSPYANIQRQVRVFDYLDEDVAETCYDRLASVVHRVEIPKYNELHYTRCFGKSQNVNTVHPSKRTIWTVDGEYTRIPVKTIRQGEEFRAFSALDLLDRIDRVRDSVPITQLDELEKAEAEAKVEYDSCTVVEEFVMVPVKKGKHKWILGKLTGKVRAFEVPPHEESYVEVHDSCHVHYKDLNINDPITEYWVYQDALRLGPTYEHGADTLEGLIERCAGITVSRRTVDGHIHPRYFMTPEVSW